MSAIVLSAFLMGLFGGVHCVAMCGGVVSVLCSAAPRCPTAQAGRLAHVPYWLAYNAGRLASYALLGLLFGTLGSLATSFPLEPLRFGLRAIAALCMLSVGLHLVGLPSAMKRLESLGAPLWKRLMPLTRRFLPLRTPWHALVLGAAWGLMPCGLLYGALALAATAGSPLAGSVTLAAFGVGTLPVMVTLGAMAEALSRWLARAWVRKAAGALVLAFGLWSSAGVARQAGIGGDLGLERAHRCCPKR